MEIHRPVINSSNENATRCHSLMLMGNPPLLKIFLLSIFTIVLFFGTIFNSIALWVFCFKVKTFTETRVFMMNLLLSDCCLLFTIPFRMYSTIQNWDLSNLMCQTIRSSYFLNTYISIAIITLISVDRYLAIKFPLRSRTLRSPKKAVIACGIVWLLFIASRIYIEMTGFIELSNPNFCFRKTTARPLKRNLYFSVLGFYIPLPILTFCSLQVIRVLKMKDKTCVYEQQCIQKSINIVSTNLVVFLVCFLPVHIGNIVRFVAESLKIDCTLIKHINDYVYGCQAIGDLNCCLDALCYYFVAKEFPEIKSKSSEAKQVVKDLTQTQESNL